MNNINLVLLKYYGSVTIEKDEYTRISLRIPKDLLKKFDEHSKNKGHHRRDQALLNLIKKELKR